MERPDCFSIVGRRRHACVVLLYYFALLVLSVAAGTATFAADPGETFPELGEVKEIIGLGRPEGVVFLVMDHDTEAYEWVLPRLERYVKIIRQEWPDLPLAVLSHGDEIFSLLAKNENEYPEFHRKVRHLVTSEKIDFQVCGAFAALSGVDESEFADFVEVVPSAPTQISDYRLMGYELVHLELTW